MITYRNLNLKSSSYRSSSSNLKNCKKKVESTYKKIRWTSAITSFPRAQRNWHELNYLKPDRGLMVYHRNRFVLLTAWWFLTQVNRLGYHLADIDNSFL